MYRSGNRSQAVLGRGVSFPRACWHRHLACQVSRAVRGRWPDDSCVPTGVAMRIILSDVLSLFRGRFTPTRNALPTPEGCRPGRHVFRPPRAHKQLRRSAALAFPLSGRSVETVNEGNIHVVEASTLFPAVISVRGRHLDHDRRNTAREPNEARRHASGSDEPLARFRQMLRSTGLIVIGYSG